MGQAYVAFAVQETAVFRLMFGQEPSLKKAEHVLGTGHACFANLIHQIALYCERNHVRGDPVWPKNSHCKNSWTVMPLSVGSPRVVRYVVWAINGDHCEPAGKWGSSWSGHASWPTSAGRWIRSCCCGMNISPLRTRS